MERRDPLANRRAKGKWSWKCCCEWGYLLHEAYVHGEGSTAHEWAEELKNQYGEDINKWPHIGCMSGFAAWKRGPTMVMEWCVNEEKDEWVAFLSERIPSQLDDCIKECHMASLEKAIIKDVS